VILGGKAMQTLNGCTWWLLLNVFFNYINT